MNCWVTIRQFAQKCLRPELTSVTSTKWHEQNCDVEMFHCLKKKIYEVGKGGVLLLPYSGQNQ